MKMLITLYAALLRLYPAAFRTQYADEMRAVFSAALRDARRRGLPALLLRVVRELLTYPPSLWAAYQLPREVIMDAAADRRRRLGRWGLRAATLIIALFVVYPILEMLSEGGVNTFAMPFALLSLAAAVAVLSTWWSPRWGGLLTVGAGILVAAASGAYVFTVYEIYNPELELSSRIFTSMMAALWGVPYVLLGLVARALAAPHPQGRVP